MSIRSLPPDVIAQVKSATAITSLNGVICELLKNSLDAGSTRLDISVDYARGGCIVEDDGFGILPSEFGENGGLGKLYHSSKLGSQTPPVHGGQGTFLAALSAMALLSITSSHHLHRSHNTIIMYKSEVVSRHVPSPPQLHLPASDHGTRVIVRNLFGNMPVRVKQRALTAEKPRRMMKEWDELKRDVLLFLLTWRTNVSLTLRDIGSDHKMVIRAAPTPFKTFIAKNAEVSRVCSLLTQASLITPEEKSSWVDVSASSPYLIITGAISLIPCPSKLVQFMSFGIRPHSSLDGHSILHDEINVMFMNSAFGIEEEPRTFNETEGKRRKEDFWDKNEGYTGRELKGMRKGVDRWPMYYINIGQNESLDTSTARRVGFADALNGDGENLGAIVDLLQVMVLEFLTRHHFRPTIRQTHRSNPGNRIFDNDSSQKVNKSMQSTSSRSQASHIQLEPSAWESNLKSQRYEQEDAQTGALKPSATSSPRQFSSKQDSQFHAWSRIKSGARVARSFSSKEHAELGSLIARPSTAPPLSPSIKLPSPLSEGNLKSMKHQPAPLFSRVGRIVRPPFNDTFIKHDQPPVDTVNAPVNLDAASVDSGEDVVVWINPITKVRSLVSQRTGITIPVRRLIPHKGTNQAPNISIVRLTCRPHLKSALNDEPSPWLSNVLQQWDNPIYQPVETSISAISFDDATATNLNVIHGGNHHCTRLNMDRAFTESPAGFSGRISKDALKNAQVVSQVDKKFILIKIDSTESMKGLMTINEGLLGVIDQHAADERVRIEQLMAELCTPLHKTASTGSKILTINLDKPLTFEIPNKEVKLLESRQQHFTEWGILYDVSRDLVGAGTTSSGKDSYSLVVRSLPSGIVERCKSEPRLLIELIRTEANIPSKTASNTFKLVESPSNADDKHSWLGQMHACPQGIVDMLNSRACRSAIMFNDELSKGQAETLVRNLAECALPFQCAHGRPSLVPLVDLGRLNPGPLSAFSYERREEGGHYGSAFRKWKSELEKGA